MGEMDPELFRRIFKTVKEFIHILDTSGRILKTNPHTIKTLAYRKKEMIGKPLSNFFSPASKKIFSKAFPRVKEKGEGREEVELVCKNGGIITVDCQTIVIRDTNENISYIIVVQRDITERKKTETTLKKSEEKYRILFERSNDGIFLANSKTGRYIDANEAAERITGRTISELKTLSTKDITPHLADERLHKLVTNTDRFNFGEVSYVQKDGTTITTLLDGIRLNEELIFGVAHDITDRKKAETRREFASELLKVLNSPREDMDLVKTILLKIKDFTDIDAVGIRLREGDDFPYYRTSGFSEEFVEAERNLCERDTKGAIIRDSSGSPLFECMCGNILLHRTDPSKPYFTEGGSFWSNNTSYLLTTTTEEERLARTRNRCNSDGYESVALIPLRSGSEIIGLLQLNDHRIGRFTIKDIEFYEEIGSSIGVAIKRVKAGEEHRLVNEIMSNMNEGVYLINMKDIEIVWANPKFERMFGYDPGEMLGKHASIVNAPTERDPLETAKEITKVLKETGEWHGEVNNIKKDGTPFWCYANVSVFNHPFYGEVMVSVHTDITEGKIVQEELLKSERKHRTLFESMSLGVVYQNAEGYITSANPSAERILGLTLDQMQGRTSIDPRWKAIDVNGADFPGETHPSMVALKTGQKVRNIIMGVFNPIFGENTWININAVPHTKPGEDKPFQVYTVFEDITERMSAEAELQKSEERFKQFFENVPEYCYMVSLDGKIMDVNRSATNMLGYKKEDILGKPFLTTIYAPSSREIAKNLFIEWKVKGEMRNKELNIVTKDGTERTVLLSANAVRGSNGEIIHSVSIQRDITERKKAEEKVRKMSQAVEQSPALVVITDTKGDIEYVNPKFCQLTGYKTEEVMGKNPRILKSGNQTEEFYKYLWDTITAGKEWSGEFHNKKKNGELYWEFASISPIINEKGLMTHFIAIKEDVTKRKALEEKLKEYADHLEDEVKKQTNELIQSEKMASLGMLVAGVAHEVNNPLAYLKSNSNHLKQDFSQLKKILDEKKIDIDFEEFEEIIDTNLEGLDRIAQITKALKRFARPDTSGRAYVNINEGIRDTLILLSNQLKFRVEVHLEYGELPMVDCNIGQLNQVFMNLIINASQSMDKGDLWIKTWSDNENIFIQIRDNGMGIPPEKIKSIFDPFYTSKESGTGLGLSISYRIIQDHKGEIMVESEGDRGTTMTIKLPVEV